MSGLFWQPDLARQLAEGNGERVWLRGIELHHARVRRLRAGEILTLGDGRGLRVWGRLEARTDKALGVRVEEVKNYPKPEQKITLAQALARRGRDELGIQMAVELGVDGVIPWAAKRSAPRWPSPDKGLNRWQKIAQEAAKQSLRAWFARVEPLRDTAEIAAEINRFDTTLLLVPGQTPLSRLNSKDLVGSILVLIGPEGGVDEEEIDCLLKARVRVVGLGSEVLRVSTASAAAMALLNLQLGRW